MRHVLVAAWLILALGGCGGGGGGGGSSPAPGPFAAAGTPTPTGQVLPATLVVGWFDADAYPDVAVSNGVQAAVHVLIGGPDGFTLLAPHTFGIPDDPELMGTGFFDFDAFTDLVVVGSGLHAVLLGVGDGTFTPAAAVIGPILPLTFATAMAVGEMSGDVFDDVAYGTVTGHVGLAICNGAGAFVAGPDLLLPSPSEVKAIAVGDLDSDGDLDVVALQDDLTLSAFAGDGVGGLLPLGAPLVIGGTPRRIVTGRFDLLPGDDVAVLDDSHQQVRLFSGGAAPFSAPFETVPLPELGICIATYPTFAALDALVVGSVNVDLTVGHLSFLTGDMTATTWTSIPIQDAPVVSIAVAVADMNFDGLLDLIVGSAHIEPPEFQASVQVLLKTGP